MDTPRAARHQSGVSTHSRKASRLMLLARLAAVRAREKAAAALSVKGVHAMRIAVRRLRAALRALDRDDRGARRLQDALGAVRDLHVQQRWVQRHARRSAIGSKLDHRLAAELSRAAPRLLAALARWKKDARRLDAHLAGCRPRRLAGRQVRGQLRRAIEEAAMAIRAAGDFCEPITVHEARIRVKKLRYLLELFEPRVDSLLDELRPLQDLLGDLHDADVRRERLSSQAPQARPAERAEILKLLKRIHQQRDILARKALRAAKPWLTNRCVTLWAASARARSAALGPP